ncbi:MAG TPA: PKD domain-containing protein [Cryomorphaceae bacterium]|nr:PKD domain-containing protein [Cryomorphaceae bacterium]
MANKLNNFDEAVKNSLNGYEEPYDPTHWDDLEKELQFTAPGMSLYFGAITTGVVITSVVFMSMLFFFSDVQKDQPATDSVVVENPDMQNGEPVENNSTSQAATATAISDDSSTASSDANEENQTTTEGSDASEKGVFINRDEAAASSSLTDENRASEPGVSDGGNQSEVDINTRNEENTLVAEAENKSNKKNVQTGCTGLTIDFDASDKYGSDAKYLWNFGDGFFSNKPNPSHTFNKEGTFDVSLSVTSHATGQITSNVVQAMIEVVEAPIANLEIGISGANAIAFNNRSYNASDIQWKLDDELISSKSELTLSLVDNTHYELMLIALNDGGCTDTLMANVNSIEAGSQFPRAFETSYGNEFSPGAIIDTGSVTAVKIYNGNEELVFEGSGNKGWDGTLPNGSQAVKGNYKWIMSVDKENTIDVYHGKLVVR